jgi:hypothetical protein
VGLHPEGHRSVAPPGQRCSAGFRDAAAGPHREVQHHPEAARIACPAVPPVHCLVRAEAVHPAVPAADLYPARPSVAAERRVQALPKAAEVTVAQRLGPPAVWAVAAAVAQEVPRVPEASAAQPKAAGVVRAAQDAAAGPQPGVASDAEVLLPAEGEVPDVAAVAPRQGAEAERVAAGAVLLPGAAVPVAEVQRQAAQDEPAVLLSAAAWVAALSTQLREDRLAPSLPARSAHARARLRIAQP